ncbi:hypothetical protein DC083_08505 [Ignatzschineria ureiclastica]|uniref:BMC domain-containing protein n=1 Tax=Ignatzschineria ureiclastica TaxID=472582 RepID=A0A2U2ACH4_9GAMM|nr:BMC domain-containing protein [Ignatzschineria ureiclastica]PWD80353.1 hypothetical protein DC083_08505 [Ignatzschineria ureiclastica]GHA00157.1 hypothetical protein GCM10007162_15510 [Ignatzschineria ureiclastica]
MINTLGLLEVYGFVAGVEAMDAMLKSANVRLLSHSVTPSALVTIVIEGDLAACRAALDAGCAATEYIGGKVLCQKVLGRPERDTERMVLSFCGNDSELHQEILQSYGVASKAVEVSVDSAPQLTEVFEEEPPFEADNEPVENETVDRYNSQMDEDENERISQQPELEIEVLDLEESTLEALTEEVIYHDEVEAVERGDVSRESSELPDDEEDLSQEEVAEAMIEAAIAEANLTNEESSIAQEVAETRNKLAITELERMAHASIEHEHKNATDELDLTDELLAEDSVVDDDTADDEIAEVMGELEVEEVVEEAEEAEAHAELSEVIIEEATIWQAERDEQANAVSEHSDGVGQDETEEQNEEQNNESNKEQNKEPNEELNIEENLESLDLDETNLETLDLEELLEDIDIEFDPEMEEIFKLVASFLRDKGEKGSNLLEMSNRLGIDLANLKRVLHRSVRQKLLRKNSNRYFINL